jgi:hypothetical protein
MSKELRVMVDMRASSTKETVSATELPGFVVNPLFAPEPIHPDDDSRSDTGFRIHGSVKLEALDNLRRNVNVLDVYLDAEVIEFPISCNNVQAWPLASSAFMEPVGLHRYSPE